MSIRPFYEQDGITIYHGDCRDASQVIPIGWADYISADPPYGETSLDWDKWPFNWAENISAILKPTGSMWCFGTLRMFIEKSHQFSAFKMSHEIIWEKHNGSGFHVDRFRRVHEIVAHFYPLGSKWAEVYKSPQFTMDATARTVRRKSKPAQWHGKTGPTVYISHDGGPRRMRSVIRVRSCHGDALNETQKPEGIVRPLMEYACRSGGNVFVPFVGSGTDLVVARELGMRAIGFEIRQEQCEVAAKRLKQGILFGTEAHA